MEEQQRQQQKPKSPLPIDWSRQFQSDSPPRDYDILPASSSADQDDLSAIPDHKLRESIQSKKRTLDVTGKNLPDKGTKLRATIDRYQQELTHREQQQRLRQEDDKDRKPQPGQASSTDAVTEGVSNDLREENLLSQAQSQSTFTSCFVKQMEDNTNCTASDAFRKEMSLFKHSDYQKIQDKGEPRRRKRHRSSSRQLQFQCPSKLSKRNTFSDGKTCRATSSFGLRNNGRNLPRCYPKVHGRKDAFQAIQLDGSRSRKGLPIVLDVDDDDGGNNNDEYDDDEAHIVEKTENKFPEYLKEAKIYFPSRDDPECVEICFTDTNCLAPEGYLTSTIMNFYIQYLQQQALLTNRSLSAYHFFNTYFYKKLKEAVSYKQSDREIFAKFRRWWKGVNIFQKAYVLIPIHEDLHWSLIIICIPDKEDESGPIILHLDSLGLHSSKSVFDNIKSYLIEEKNYMDREDMASDVSIADRIWKCLPRRIESQIIQVPQQKNDYDCGLFVLYFIERFMEEAPERLKMKDLDMFGRRWFKPQEASNLRVKIRKLLVEKLQNSVTDNCNLESSPSSSAGPATDCVETARDSLTGPATDCVETTEDSVT
ncbi:ubiquitin-like-specific protease 1D isoform X1 [Glycine soja]|uniref:Ubiquitin-like-specific protease 1D isoform A n=2 Tax=Glycine soja TaxID=3848 RepID=A0A445JLM9_GLYSO|nr:ubiquitin-like-specific protease 1D isoform X1 [Glycine soja]RZB99314.1 Ubiquitin-like-specific protease 1D isoform A [Glycine soja]